MRVEKLISDHLARLFVVAAVPIITSLVTGEVNPVFAGGPSRHVAFILDCSASMGQPLESHDPSDETAGPAGGTRFAAALETLKSSLDQLAAEGDHEVALWLFGHRLAWDGSDEPNLMEQTAYLEHSLGFKVLAKLLPGDDVELVFPMQRLEPGHLEGLGARLETVKPWGEDPLYLAIVRTLDNLSRHSNAGDTSVVVITDGDNRQWISQYETTHAQVLEATDRRDVPVHIIHVGNTSDDNVVHDGLRQIAGRAHGSFAHATTSDALMSKVALAVGGRTARQEGDAAQPTAEPSADTVSVVAAAVRQRTIQGQVHYYKRAVRRATVTLEGSGIAPVQTDSAGRFTFENVPDGEYVVAVEGVARNVSRRMSTAVTLGPSKGPTVQVDIELP